MFELSRELAIAGDRRPSVGQHLHLCLALVDHRLDREDHAAAQFQPFARLAVVQDVRRFVKAASDAVSAEVAHHLRASLLGVALDGSTDVARRVAGAHRFDACQQRFVSDARQTLGGNRNLVPDPVHARAVSVPPVENHRHIDVGDVAFVQNLRVVRNAVTDNMVDADAGRFRKTTIVQRRRDGIVRTDVLFAKPVEIARVAANRHMRRNEIQCAGC